jgi:hypothetical protein
VTSYLLRMVSHRRTGAQSQTNPDQPVTPNVFTSKVLIAFTQSSALPSGSSK